MLGVILKILSILGIVLLVILAVFVFILLLILFMPIVYRADAEKKDAGLKANVKARWLFGFLRADYNYPEPGNIIVKVLWFTVFDSSQKKIQKNEAIDTDEKVSSDEQAKTEEKQAETIGEDAKANQVTDGVDSSEKNLEGNASTSLKDKLFAKYEKIKYTIQSFYDKMKHIWENISFYKKLLQDEETKLLFSHVCKRVGKVLCHIRPKKIKANVIFGAESPDTTGYTYGIYCMISPKLGKDVCVIPDFEQKILQGTVCLAGHITVFKLLVNALAVLFDKRLHLFIRRIKKHSAKQVKPSGSAVTVNE